MKTKTPQLGVASAFSKQHWRSINTSKHIYPTVSTGFAELDQTLQLGGWPLGVSTEIGVDSYGLGELRLLMPALREVLKSATPHTIWIAPPHSPYAPALLKEGLDLNNLLVVRPKNMADTLWATEQALLVDSCAAVFSWTGEYKLDHKEARRLQLAAEKSSTWYVQFRHSRCLNESSAARLRLQLQSNAQGCLDVNVLKQPQGCGGQQCTVSLAPHYELWRRIPVELLPQQNRPLATHKIIPQTIQASSSGKANSRVLYLD